MAALDASPAGRSDATAFLLSDVGTEPNGLPLTILSILARLGHDPWAEAERLAGIPKAAAIDCLAQNIQLVPSSLATDAQAHAIAARLIERLPEPVQVQIVSVEEPSGPPALHEWVPITLFLLFLIGGAVANHVSAHPPAHSTAVAGNRIAAARPLIMPVSPLGR